MGDHSSKSGDGHLTKYWPRWCYGTKTASILKNERACLEIIDAASPRYNSIKFYCHDS